ncbi:MAG: hypothetical protein MUF00_17165 [Gemmatimonadaceae bacterium]|jgi:hypothetical protein|nr:hypothetical protein [Gemmatimonadaceae bacterium]
MDTRAPVDVALEPDPVIEAYKRDVDRTLLRENLRLSPEQRVIALQRAIRQITLLRKTFARATR